MHRCGCLAPCCVLQVPGLVWDDTLAASAAKWAAGCPNGHSGYAGVGENMACEFALWATTCPGSSANNMVITGSNVRIVWAMTTHAAAVVVLRRGLFQPDGRHRCVVQRSEAVRLQQTRLEHSHRSLHGNRLEVDNEARLRHQQCMRMGNVRLPVPIARKYHRSRLESVRQACSLRGSVSQPGPSSSQPLSQAPSSLPCASGGPCVTCSCPQTLPISVSCWAVTFAIAGGPGVSCTCYEAVACACCGCAQDL